MCCFSEQLGKFYALCEDSIWGVRKACCECFAQVSSVCSPTVRRTDLSQLFINLIYDQSRWVSTYDLSIIYLWQVFAEFVYIIFMCYGNRYMGVTYCC